MLKPPIDRPVLESLIDSPCATGGNRIGYRLFLPGNRPRRVYPLQPTSCFSQYRFMSHGQAAHAQAPAKASRDLELPGQNLTLEEILRVMDVAREMRDRRESAEEMFRRDDLRSQLRDKIMRTARLAGDKVTAAEVDAAIGQYFETLHTYEDPQAGVRSFLAHCWVWRNRIMWGAAAMATIAGGFWFLFG